MQDELDQKIQSYYSQGKEDDRLRTRSVGGRLERERLRRLVGPLLAPGSRVLDVGGATGVHADWLAAEGHHVTLIDPVPAQVAQAAQAGTFRALVGDARALEEADASADAVLLCGPLYHLASREDRLRALREAARVLRPGGLLAAQGISRLTSLVDSAVHLGYSVLDAEDLHVLRTGEWSNPGEGFPGGHFHSPQELSGEVEEAGFTLTALHGLEGPNLGAWELLREGEQIVDLALQLVEAAEAQARAAGVPEHMLAGYSPHLLALAQAPS